MAQDIMDYCKSCQICATSKSLTEKPHRLLKTMPVPTHPWQYIGIDFMGPLPKSTNWNGAFDMICVIIDLLTVMVHLIPTQQNYKAADMAEVIFNTVLGSVILPPSRIPKRNPIVPYVVRPCLSSASIWLPPHSRTYHLCHLFHYYHLHSLSS